MMSKTAKKRELLFSVTAKDCRWDYLKASSKGGQKANKTSVGVRCTHKTSGAVGKCVAYRSQWHNKREAFVRMTEDSRFKVWHRLEVAKRLGTLKEIERRVQESMRHIRVEVYENGEWIDEEDTCK
jgi:protein subunit release factor B